MIVGSVEVNLPNLLDRWGITGKFNSYSNELLAECPWRKHRGGQSKLYINLDSGLWQCKACPDKKGNIYQLTAIMQDISIGDATSYLIDHGSDIDYDTFPEKIEEILSEEEHKALSYREDKYLIQEATFLLDQALHFPTLWKQLGVGSSAVERFNLKYLPNARYPFLIPVSVDGQDKYLIQRAISPNTQPKYRYQFGFPRRDVLYGLDKIVDADKIIVCEGALDAVSIWTTLRVYRMWEYGVVSLLGTTMSDRQRDLLLENANEIILFLDDDNAGHQGMHDMGSRLYNALVRRVDYDQVDVSGGDPRDLSAKEQKQLIVNAQLFGLGDFDG